MHRATYLEVQHERHLNGLCAYPPCANAPAAPYRSRKRFVVSTAARTITERDGNDDQAFCSRRCAARGAYVAEQLGTEAPWLGGGGGAITLLEDLEARGDVVWGGRRGDVLTWVKKMEAPAAPAPVVEDGGVSSLLASLSIVERATPAEKPAPPRLDAPRLPVEPGAPVAVSGTGELAGLPLPLPGGEVQVPSPLFSKKQKDESAGTGRRGGSSLLPTEHSSLAASVLDASRKMRPESSDDESEEEEPWAKAMGWGAGPEVDALFAVAAESRKLMREEGEEGPRAEGETEGKQKPEQTTTSQ
jgi:hypothetical protein